jgi:hypothetical protein
MIFIQIDIHSDLFSQFDFSFDFGFDRAAQGLAGDGVYLA